MSIQNIHELEHHCRQLEHLGYQQMHPFFAELALPPRLMMTSFGRPFSTVRYYDSARGHDDYSRGDQDDSIMVIFYGEHWTEIDRRELIPHPWAKQVLLDF